MTAAVAYRALRHDTVLHAHAATGTTTSRRMPVQPSTRESGGESGGGSALTVGPGATGHARATASARPAEGSLRQLGWRMQPGKPGPGETQASASASAARRFRRTGTASAANASKTPPIPPLALHLSGTAQERVARVV